MFWFSLINSALSKSFGLQTFTCSANIYLFKVNNRNTKKKVRNKFKVKNKDTRITHVLFLAFFVSFRQKKNIFLYNLLLLSLEKTSSLWNKLLFWNDRLFQFILSSLKSTLSTNSQKSFLAKSYYFFLFNCT